MVRDWLVNHPLMRAAASQLFKMRGRLEGRNLTRRLALLARSARLCPDGWGQERLDALARDALRSLNASAVDWSEAGLPGSIKPEVPKALLIKPPVSAVEKGVLYVAFEDQWLRLLRSGAEEIARRYDLVLSPSWSPSPDLAMLLADCVWPGKIHTLLSRFEDASRVAKVSDRLIPVPLLASSWVDPDAFFPFLGGSREIDIVMVASLASFKRHWLLFRAIRQLPRQFRILLFAGAMPGRSADDLLAEARSFGVADRFELRMRAPRTEILRGLCRSKVSLILSRREGSCVAVAESLFADTPVGVYRDAFIGSKAFIQRQTGRLLEPGNLARQLADFVEESGKYSPRAWALANISCHRSQEILNAALRRSALAEGRPWTRDVLPFQFDFLPRYLTATTAGEMQPWIEEFQDRYGIRLASGCPHLTSETSTGPAVEVCLRTTPTAAVR
jgi:glycosyltransferase involved in cell wall biosynthesis